MDGDAGLRAVVAAWEARLAPLTALAAPEAPPPGLWDRIATALDGPRRRRAPPPRGHPPLLALLGDRGERGGGRPGRLPGAAAGAGAAR